MCLCIVIWCTCVLSSLYKCDKKYSNILYLNNLFYKDFVKEGDLPITCYMCNFMKHNRLGRLNMIACNYIIIIIYCLTPTVKLL